MRPITTGSELTDRWTRMRRSLVQFSGPVSLIHAPSLAVSITTTPEFRFSVHTGLPMPVRRSFLLDAITRSPHFSSYSSVNQAGAGRLFERSGERAIFLAVGAGERGDPVQVILRPDRGCLARPATDHNTARS